MCGAIAAEPVPASSATMRAASAVELAARSSACGSCGPHVRVTLRRRHRDRQHRLDVGQRRARLGQQAVLDVEHHLALDQQVVAERQLVLRQVDHSLDRVLDRDEPEIDLAGFHGVEHVGHRAVQHVLGGREVGLRLQGLLGEGAERPEEADLRRWVDHMSQVIGGTPCNRAEIQSPTWRMPTNPQGRCSGESTTASCWRQNSPVVRGSRRRCTAAPLPR